jgi:hypothetical protein
MYKVCERLGVDYTFGISGNNNTAKPCSNRRRPNLPSRYGQFGRLSPNGKQVLFQIVTPPKDNKRAQPELAVLDIATGKVTPVAVPDNGMVWSYCWSGGGKWIAYTWMEVVENRPGDMAIREFQSQVVVCMPDGKSARTIASEKAQGFMFPGMDWR